MARDIYFKDVKFSDYSLWHRALPQKLGLIDMDGVGICLKCKEPLYLKETAFDVGQPWKATTTTAKLARMCGLPSFLVFYKVKGNEVIGFRVQQLTPEKGSEVNLTPEAWVQAMELLQDRHNMVCTKKDQA
jgi:hypothetical protein